jgi:hypothetical protein
MKQLVALCFVLLLALFGLIAFLWHNEDKLLSAQGASSETPYGLPKSELVVLHLMALRGNCAAANRLGMYNWYGALQPDEAIRWLRVASRCPDVVYRVHLLAILVTLNPDPKLTNEISKLITEIQQTDPAEALVWRQNAEKFHIHIE